MTKDLIKSTLESSYKRENWIDLIRNVFNNGQFNAKPVQISIAKNDIADDAFEIGSFETADDRIIGIYEIKIKRNINLERNRVGLRQLLRSVYKQVDGAFIVFDQGARWRFSYVSEINVRDENGKLIKSQTEPKRFTYLLGEGISSRTAIERFNKLLGKGVNLSDIKDAFSVDTLTKEFYRELSDWYFWALQHVEFPDDEEKNKDVRNATSTIRLITRIMFVWFLKQKGLIPDELFNKEELDKILKYNDKRESTYYKAILQNLFFATLNTEMGDANRKFVDRQYGIQGFYRYKRFFKDADRFLELTKNIPFLNGGLFENLDKNIGTDNSKRIDCFSNRLENENRLAVPDSLFFGDETVDLSVVYDDKKRKNVEVHGLINILKKYNFTIEENTPLDVEVALDPELLGKVFENLLASYNPETQSTARKQTGSFYTPREVVDYMVDECLKSFLLQKLNEQPQGYINIGSKQVDFFGNDARIGQLGLEEVIEKGGSENVRYNLLLDELLSYTSDEHKFNVEEVKLLIGAIDNCKILDPACGSGAYPMGILHKMVHVLHKLDPNNKLWKEKQIARVKSLRESASQFPDLTIRENWLKEIDKTEEDIEKAFANNELDYGRKLYLIENCIYGVDIQAIAVQIAKLRFFISLVVDQTIHVNERNLGIRPLPNLETKFVAANTLISLEKENNNLFTNPEIDKKKSELKRVRLDHFEAKTPGRKNSLRKRDEQLRNEIATLLVTENELQPKAAKLLANWNPYDQNLSSSFFDMEWMFGIIDGFDIIIGNPPYVGEKGHKELFRELKESPVGKRFYQRKIDLFYLFFHISLDLLKKNGISSYITTNYYITATAAKKLRSDLKSRASIIQFVNFNEAKIFESALGQHNAITLFKKGFEEFVKCCSISFEIDEIKSSNQIDILLKTNSNFKRIEFVSQKELYEGGENYIRLQNTSSGLKNIPTIISKMINDSIRLDEICNVNQGILTGCDKIGQKHINQFPREAFLKGDGVYVLNGKECKALKEQSSHPEIFKPWFKNSDISKYQTKTKAKEYVIYASRDIDIKGDVIEKHFKKYESVIKNRSQERGEMQAALKLGKWWVIFAARKGVDFESEKIVAPQRSLTNTFGFNSGKWYASADVYFITRRTDKANLKYLLGILNSKLMYYWLYYKGKRKGESLELYEKPLSEIPIKLIPNETLIVKRIDKIFEKLKVEPTSDTSKEEKEIDILVYKIYGLDFSEAVIIDPTLTMEEFDKLKI